MKYRTQPAPISASHELLMNQHRIMVGGTSLCICAAKCAGNAASKTSHQTRPGVRSNAARRMELGGHRTDTGCGWNVSANPILAPR